MTRPRRRSPAPARTLLAFGAAWSPPWRLLRAGIEALASDEVRVQCVDVDEDPATAERYRVITVPTVLILVDGKERRRVTGAVSPAALKEMVSR